MIFRVGFVAAVALGALSAAAGDDNKDYTPANATVNFVTEVTNRIVMASAGTKDPEQYFADLCTNELFKSVVAAKDGNKAYVIMVEGRLEISYNNAAYNALTELFSKDIKIALLCNCPDMSRYGGTDVSGKTLKRADFLEPQVVIQGNQSGPCLHVTKKSTSSSKLASNNIGLIYGVKFVDGKADQGGAVDAHGNLRFVNCVFENCEATGGSTYGGGAIYGPADTDYLPYAFTPTRFGKNLLGVTQVSCSFCTFQGCTAKNKGGAICHHNERRGFVSDCVFLNCVAKEYGGGALYNVTTVWRSMFSECTSKNWGGAMAYARNVYSCLFVKCSAEDDGVLTGTSGGAKPDVNQCTFVDCSASKNQTWIHDGSKVDNSLFVGNPEKMSSYKTQSKADGASAHNCVIKDKTVFVSDSDFHLKPAATNVGLKITSKDALDLAKGMWDLDRLDFDEGGRVHVYGCYRYNSEDEIKETKLEYDWATLNPLIVTTPEDVVDPFDGRISFREACSNLMAHIEATPPRVDQWPKITFDLPSGSRLIEISSEKPIEISDAKRMNPEWREEKSPGDPEKYKPFVIDGGDKGITVVRNGKGTEPALKLGSAGTLINMSFIDASVEAGANRAEQGWAAYKFSSTLYVTNCAFTGGDCVRPLLRASGAGTNGFEFTHCSFVNPSNATAAVRFDQTVAFPASFTCCTFAGFDKGEGTVVMPKAGGDLSFGSCTFAMNGNPDDDTFADIRVGDGVEGGSLHLADCLFADGWKRALRCPAEFTTYGSITNDETELDHGTLLENFAGSAKNALDSSVPDRLTVAGVPHVAFPPKHTGSARRGRRSISFADGTVYEQPKTDIFGAPQAGSRTSLGSRFVDDVETKSMEVNLAEDVVDAYDDKVSFREAIAYGFADYRRFGVNSYLTPTFSTNVFLGGEVCLSLDRAIAIDGQEKAFRDGYTVWIKPGKGQSLTIRSNPLGGGGIFSQTQGSRMKFDDVFFGGCSNYEGPGGVLDSNGRTRFNRCRFENCFAAEVKIIPAARALSDAYKPVLDTFLISAAAREIIRLSVPPGRRACFDGMEDAVSGALAACSNTVRILQDRTAPFLERLDGVNASLSNFLAATENVVEPFNVFCLYAPTIASSLSRAGIYVNAEWLAEDLVPARASMAEFKRLRSQLTKTNDVLAVTGFGGAINLGETAECIAYDASAHGCGVFGDGGFLANRGDFKGVNLTLTGNNAVEGACIYNASGTNQLACVTIADNVSETNGAVFAENGVLGIVNSIVIANAGGNVVTGPEAVDPVVERSLIGDYAKDRVFSSSSPLEGGDTNHLAQLYYPLAADGLASHTGTFVFFGSDATQAYPDGLDSEWIKSILHSTDFDATSPAPKPLLGKGRWNTYLFYDLLGQRVEIWEDPDLFVNRLPASMGPVPNVPPEQEGMAVTIPDDVVSAFDNETSLREAATLAMEVGPTSPVPVCVFFRTNDVITLKNQIVVPSGKTLRISATLGEVTLKPAAGCSNRFFRVERGGRLELTGLILDGGYARGIYEVGKAPADDDDGGAICSEGTLVLTDCTIQNCKANGYGGAVWSNGGTTATRCTFTENFAQRGGGLCSSDEKLRLSGVSITCNTAQDYGGGLYLVTGSNDVIATGMAITGNTANGETVTAGPNRGGGVYLTENMSVHPGTVTISGTVADNTGGNDSRDGGTEPVSPVQTSETPEKGGVPLQPTPRHMHAANALAATSETVIDRKTMRDVLVLNGDYTASEQVRITGGACLTLTGTSTSVGTVEVRNRTYAEGKHPRITVEKGAKLVAERGFYCGEGSARAELVLDNGTAQLSGGEFVEETSSGSSGTITLRNGASLNADMDITLNSAVRTNTVSASTLDMHDHVLSVENGARLEISSNSMFAVRSLTVGERGSVLLADSTNVLSALTATADGAGLVVSGGCFTADAVRLGGRGQSFRFENAACEFGRLTLDWSEVLFAGGKSASFTSISLPDAPSSGGDWSLQMTFDGLAAECAQDVVLAVDKPVTLAFRGDDAGLHCKGKFTYGIDKDSSSGPHTLLFDIPREGWTEPPLQIDGECRITSSVVFSVPPGGWMSSDYVKVPLIGFKSRPSFLNDEWLAGVSENNLRYDCKLAYDEELQALTLEYTYDHSQAICELNGRLYNTVEDALAVAQATETVRLIGSTKSYALEIPDSVTLDLNRFQLTEYGREDGGLPRITKNRGVLVVYYPYEAAALFAEDMFTGTMRFGETVKWSVSGGGTMTFLKGTDVTVRTGGGKTDVYLVTTAFADTGGLPDGWAVDVFGPAELGGSGYGDCSLRAFEDVRVVSPLVLSGATLAVSGTVSFAEGAYIDLRDLSKGGIYARNPIDFSHFRITDPEVSAAAGVVCTELDDGTFWYHLDKSAKDLVAAVDNRCYTLEDAFAVANGNGHDVALIKSVLGQTSGTIPVGRSIAFDMNGQRIEMLNGSDLTFAVSNGLLEVSGKGMGSDVLFSLLHGASGDGALRFVGGDFWSSLDTVVTVDAACMSAAVELTEGACLHTDTSHAIIRLDGYADCLFDASTVRGDHAENAIVHHSASITVTNGAQLVSKGVTIRQTTDSKRSTYDFSLGMYGTNSLVRSLEKACVSSALTNGTVGLKSASNTFVCRSGSFACPTNGVGAAVGFCGSVDYLVTGGWFGGKEEPLATAGYRPKSDDTHEDMDLYWQVVKIGEEGVFVAKVGTVLYESVEAAFDAALADDVVELIADATVWRQIDIRAPVTLDLCGCKLAAMPRSEATFFVHDTGALTIDDSTGGDAVLHRVHCQSYGLLKVLHGAFEWSGIGNWGELEFHGGTFDSKTVINGNGPGSLIIRDGSFSTTITITSYVDSPTGPPVKGNLYEKIDISGGVFHCEEEDSPFYMHTETTNPPTAFLRGGELHCRTKPPESFLAEGYKYSEVSGEQGYFYRVEKAVVAKVGGTTYGSLKEAFDEANRSGKPVQLVADYKGVGGSLSVTNSYALELNNHVLAPSGKLDISIVDGASFDLDGLYDNAACRNVRFTVGGENVSSTGTLHLVGGQYRGGAFDEIVIVRRGTCLIDYGASLEAKTPVCLNGGKLEVSGATIRGEASGICDLSSGTNAVALRIFGDGTKVSAKTPVSLTNSVTRKVDLDIAGLNELRPASDTAVSIVCNPVSGAGATGGRFFGARPDDKCLVKGYAWAKRVTESKETYWTPQKNPDVVEVNGVLYDNLVDAFAEANKSGRPVKLVADYTYGGGVFSVAKSFALDLNSHVFAPYAKLDISITGGATFGLNGNSVCSNVHFVVGGENGSATGALHLASGRYYGGDADEIVTTWTGTCLIDGKANLMGKCPVGMYGGTLAMTNATIRGTQYGIRAQKNTNILRIGDKAEVYSDDKPPLSAESGTVDLDISGDCAFHAKSEDVKAINSTAGASRGQVGITGGRFYGAKPDDKYLNENYDGWEIVETESELCWTPKEIPDVAEVNGVVYKRLEKAFEEVNRSGGSVKLLMDYTSAFNSLEVTNSYVFGLNNHIFAPQGGIEIRIYDGASFELDGSGANSVCSNVYFIVRSDDGRMTGTLHLAGGRYCEDDSDGLVCIKAGGACLIDGAAILEGKHPVEMYGGALAMTNATIRGTKSGIRTRLGDASVTNVLRIGSEVRVFSDSDDYSPLSLDGMTDLDISGNCEFHPKTTRKSAIDGWKFASSQAGASGGYFYGSKPDDGCLSKDYRWVDVSLPADKFQCWTPRSKNAVVAVVNGKECKSLEEAFAEANRSGKSVKLLLDYTDDIYSLSVTNSFVFDLNNHMLVPRSGGTISVVNGASLDLKGMDTNSVCSNVRFVVGESERTAGALHLDGGRYDSPGNEIVRIDFGTCLIDGGATLAGRCPVYMRGGTLAMTNATFNGTDFGIYAYASDLKDSEKCILRIGRGVVVRTSSNNAPLHLDGKIDLDISGDCEFHAWDANALVINESAHVSVQTGISGGRFYGRMPSDKDKYLAAGYKWTNVVSTLESYWMPTPVKAPPPAVNEGIRIEDGKVFSGDFEITDAVTVRSDGSVELNPCGSVGGVRVTPVIGDLPPAEGDETEPFAVGEGSVSLTVQTIPGLTYVLLRGETPDKVDEAVAQGMATKNVMTLEDFDKPKDGAFYLIRVMIK